MSLIIAPRELLSRVIRSRVAEGKAGPEAIVGLANLATAPRKIDTAIDFIDTGSGNLLLRFFNFGKRLIGFIGAAVGRITFSITSIWGFVAQGFYALASFNWNASDQELKSQISGRNNALGGYWGGAAGQAIGYLAGIGFGAGVGLVCPVIGGPLLAATVASAVAREAAEDIIPSIALAIRVTISTLAANAAVSAYISLRRWLKQPGNKFLNLMFGPRAEQVRRDWGRSGGPNMSLFSVIEERIEKIPNQFVQGFLEELVDEAFDSFIESGYVIAYELDNAYAMAKQANKATMGPQRQVIVEPEETNNDEAFVFQGPQNLVIPAIQQSLNDHRTLYNRDVGQIVAQPV